jgi:hypothetical protein
MKAPVMSITDRILAAARDGRLLSGVLLRLSRFAQFAQEAFYRWSVGQPFFRCRNLPSISMAGDFVTLPESALLKRALDQALAGIGGPPDFVRAIEGMSGQKYRTFINLLVGSLPDARYLEVGSYAGSTAASALCGNRVKAVCIDNWSQFGGPKSTFLANIESIRSPAIDIRFVESDFRRVDYASLGRFNVYLFDGPHEEQDQYDGIVVARPALDKCFILIVDDWNWPASRLGTFRAFRDSGYSLACSAEVRTTRDNSHAGGGANSDWHNGYFFAVLVARDQHRS